MAESANPIDQLADQRDGIALTSALAVDRKELLDAAQLIWERATSQPRTVFEVSQSLLRDLVAIGLGRSDIAPAPGDSRFQDEAWRTNPLFRRLGQSYLAWSRALDEWLEKSELEGINHERARFVLDIAKDLVAPMNTFVGNPAALKRAWESRGESIVTGFRNYLDDIRHNHGYPAVADRNAFKLGTDVAASPGAVVHRNELFELIQYQPTKKKSHVTPLLYVFSQVNRFYLGDLTPDRSLFQHLLSKGIPVFAISWRNPTEQQKDWGLDTYAGGVIRAIGAIREITAQPKINLIGVCAGGLTTAAAAGVLAAREDDWLESLSLFINVLDNRAIDSDFGLFVSEQSIETQKNRVRSQGIFGEKDVFEMFAWLRPEENVMAFMRSNYLMGEHPPIHPLLFWSMDYSRLPVAFHADIVDLSFHNKLAKRELRLLGQRVDLSRVSYDIYVMAGSTDHITPWTACYRSTQLFGGHIDFVLTNQNHTQTISARAGNPHLKYWTGTELPATASSWMDQAEEHPGDWREHWLRWLKKRSGEKAPSTTQLGSESYPVLDPAPGRYVKEV